MAKLLKFEEEVLEALSIGVEQLAKAVKVTLGPKGKNVVIAKEYGYPISTKDGVTVAEEIELKNPFHNLGAQLVKEAAAKTAKVAGDGTTTAVVLTEALFKEGVKNVVAGASPTSLKKGMEKSLEVLLEALTKLAKEVKTKEEIEQIATISANNDKEVGAILAEAMEKVGKEGIISITEAKGIDTILEVVEGMQLDKGYVSPYFVTNAEKMNVHFENCRIFITDKKLSSTKDIVPILEKTMEMSSSPLLIIAEDIDSDALTTLVINKIKGGLPVCAIKAPNFGDRKKATLEDIAVLTGAEVLSEEKGMSLEDMDLSLLGQAKEIKVTQDKTVIIGGKGSKQKIQERVLQIKAELSQNTSDYEEEKLRERLASLTGGVALIHIGATTEQELKEKKARVEDALHATKAAAQEGVVPGGGVALLRAVKALDSLKLEGEEALGKEIVRKACFAPLTALADNCGKQGNLIAEKVFSMQGSEGYNGATDTFVDLIKTGVLDPVLVTKSALTNAISIAHMLLTADAMIVEKPKPKEEAGAPSMGGMSGMGGMMPGMM